MKPKKFKPTSFSHGPHAHAAHDAGGRLLQIPLNREKFNAELAAYAPGCGSPIHVPGTNGGSARCGAKLGDAKIFCDRCQPVAKQVVDSLLENDFDPESYIDKLPDRRKVRLEVTLWFDQPVENIVAVMHNVFTGLEHTASQIGLAPEDEPAVAKRIQVQSIEPPSGRKLDVTL